MRDPLRNRFGAPSSWIYHRAPLAACARTRRYQIEAGPPRTTSPTRSDAAPETAVDSRCPTPRIRVGPSSIPQAFRTPELGPSSRLRSPRLEREAAPLSAFRPPAKAECRVGRAPQTASLRDPREPPTQHQ